MRRKLINLFFISLFFILSFFHFFIFSFFHSFILAQPAPIGPLPLPKQVEWQKMETYAFVHYDLNTFTDKEWGYGDADPKTFNPSRMDMEQWVRTFRQAGMKGVIIVAKHQNYGPLCINNIGAYFANR